MAECGVCNKFVAGIRDHIRDKHKDPFYQMGPDFQYYPYSTLRELGLSDDVKPHWDAAYPSETRSKFRALPR